MAARIRPRTLPLAGVAAAGVVLGHWVAYRLSLPAQPLRTEVLVATGHAYWLSAVKVAIILGLTGAGAVVARSLRGSEDARAAPMETYSAVVVRLAVLQIAAFAAIEATERAAAGVSVLSVFSHDLFLLGLAVQFLTACVGGIVVVLLSRTARLVASALRGSRLAAPTPVSFVPSVPGALRRQITWAPSGPRAPPRS